MTSPKAQAIVEFLKANLHRKLTLREIAQGVNLSRSRVSYLIRAETGMPPFQHLKMLRMERARDLLEITFLSIKEIMAKIGIQDQSHFSRDFKKVHGLTPSEYRGLHASRNVSEMHSQPK